MGVARGWCGAYQGEYGVRNGLRGTEQGKMKTRKAFSEDCGLLNVYTLQGFLFLT